jgi:hypothetical protein
VIVVNIRINIIPVCSFYHFIFGRAVLTGFRFTNETFIAAGPEGGKVDSITIEGDY